MVASYRKFATEQKSLATSHPGTVLTWVSVSYITELHIKNFAYTDGSPWGKGLKPMSYRVEKGLDCVQSVILCGFVFKTFPLSRGYFVQVT